MSVWEEQEKRYISAKRRGKEKKYKNVINMLENHC